MIAYPLFFAGSDFGDIPDWDEQSSRGCIPNISLKERRKRARFALQYFLFTLLVLIVLLVLDVNPLWRLPLFFMFSAATTSYIQALDKT